MYNFYYYGVFLNFKHVRRKFKRSISCFVFITQKKETIKIHRFAMQKRII